MKPKALIPATFGLESESGQSGPGAQSQCRGLVSKMVR